MGRARLVCCACAGPLNRALSVRKRRAIRDRRTSDSFDGRGTPCKKAPFETPHHQVRVLPPYRRTRRWRGPAHRTHHGPGWERVGIGDGGVSRPRGPRGTAAAGKRYRTDRVLPEVGLLGLSRASRSSGLDRCVRPVVSGGCHGLRPRPGDRVAVAGRPASCGSALGRAASGRFPALGDGGGRGDQPIPSAASDQPVRARHLRSFHPGQGS